MRLILSIVLSFSNPSFAFESTPVVFKQTDMSARFIASENYEDFRIDSDLDGHVDLWVVKKDQTTAIVKFKNGKPSSIAFKRADSQGIKEAQFEYGRDHWKLSSSAARTPSVMNGTPGDNACVEQNKSVLGDLSKFTEEFNFAQITKAAQNAISCDDAEIKNEIAVALSKIMKDESLSGCIGTPVIQKSLPGADASELQYFSNKLKLDLKKISAQQEGKNLISCKKSAEGATEPTGKYTENGGIEISIPANADVEELAAKLKPLLYHELLHRSGISDEKTTDQIVNICANGKKVKPLSAQNNTLLIVKSNVDKSTNNVAKQKVNVAREVVSAKVQTKTRSIASAPAEHISSESLNIASEISSAEVQNSIPSSSNLAKGLNSSNEQSNLQASQTQSAPVLAMADRAMGVMNTPALASEDSSGSGSSSVRSTRERYQSRHNGYDSPDSKSASAASGSGTDISKKLYLGGNTNMKVVQEVDLTKGTPADASPNTITATSSGSRMIASAGRTSASDGRSDVEVASNDNLAAGRSGGSGSGSYYNSTTSGTRKTNAATRSVFSSGSAGSSRDEMLSNFTGASYNMAKGMMKESSFQQKMVEYQITVIDSSGSRWGASKGKTVFSDDGSRFIRVK
ncbi:hypothetical protein [Bdellovibrio sp. HCB288]|uniref:hypothetical protein n=1 Tax=Bdellovibrio sp. HCB288 TaxID=3394355 RepID=UPI0039B395E2